MLYEDIHGFLSYIHPLSEHDLCSWVNFYKAVQMDPLEFVSDIEIQYKNAISAIEKLSELLADDVLIYYPNRHMFGWEMRLARIPFVFNSRDEFIYFLRQSEINANWLNCLGGF